MKTKKKASGKIFWACEAAARMTTTWQWKEDGYARTYATIRYRGSVLGNLPGWRNGYAKKKDGIGCTDG